MLTAAIPFKYQDLFYADSLVEIYITWDQYYTEERGIVIRYKIKNILIFC